MTATEELVHQLEPFCLRTSGKDWGGGLEGAEWLPSKRSYCLELLSSPCLRLLEGSQPGLLLPVTVDTRGLSEGLPLSERGWLAVSPRTKALLNMSEK